MRLALKIALHFIRKKDTKRPTFTALMAVIGVAVGVAALLVVVTVLKSVEGQLKSVLLSANPNLIIYTTKGGIPQVEQYREQVLKQIDVPVEKAGLFYYNEGLMSNGEYTSPVILRAIQGEESANADDIAKIVEPPQALQSLDDKNAILANNVTTQLPKIILAKGISLKLNARVGDTVTLTLPQLDENQRSKSQKFEVSGIVTIGLNEYDQKLAFMGYLDASVLFGRPNTATGIEFRLKNPDDALKITPKLDETSPYTVRPWQYLDKHLFETIDRDGGLIMIIVLLITCVAAFNIIATLGLGVVDRKRQISLLRSVGASRVLIQQVFVTIGIVLGTVGAVVGVGLAVIILSIFSNWDLGELSAFYFVNKLPVHYDFNLMVLTVVVAVALSFVSSLVPAYSATRVSPLFGLKPGQK